MFKKNEKNIKMNFIYIIFVFICIFCLIYVQEIIGYIKEFIHVLNPFLCSIVLSFLLYPIVNKINKLIDKIKVTRINRLLSILLTYILFIGFIVFIFAYVLPDVVQSIIDIISRTPEYLENITNFLEEKNIVIESLDINVIQENINLKMQELLKNLENIMPKVFEYSKNVISGVFSTIVSFVFSIYLLIDLKRIVGFLSYAGDCLIGKEKNEKLKNIIYDITSSINNFLTGKIIDSFVIGIIVFIVLNIGHFKYALLISFIVAVTNVIPDIGPFIGAIPGVIIYLSINPKDALLFLIIIICIQQFDGMFLGPKILGKKLGIRPVLILPSVIVGGYYFGILGMVLGVPLMSVLATYTSKFLEKKKKLLEEKKETIKDNENEKNKN